MMCVRVEEVSTKNITIHIYLHGNMLKIFPWLSILFSLFVNSVLADPIAQTFAGCWEERVGSGSRVWSSISTSIDGKYLYATENSKTKFNHTATFRICVINAITDVTASGGYIYTSMDNGVTWSERSGMGKQQWHAITASYNGSRVAAVEYSVATTDDSQPSGLIYTSSDFGVTWKNRSQAGAKQWMSIASSDSGMFLVACAYYEFIYFSSDGGETWTHTEGTPREHTIISRTVMLILVYVP